MTESLDGHSPSSARGEAAWKQATEEVAARNRNAQKIGREQREAYDRNRNAARRAAEARARARLVGTADPAAEEPPGGQAR